MPEEVPLSDRLEEEKGKIAKLHARVQALNRRARTQSLEQRIKNISVLVIDDSALARRLIREPLESLHYTIEEAETGEIGLEKYTLRRHDIVTIDIVMPGIYGLEILAKLRKFNPNVRVIMVSADIHHATKAQARTLRAASILKKPVRAANLQRAVTAALEGQEWWEEPI